MYDYGAVIPLENGRIDFMNECIPTCDQSLDSIQALPAGLCEADPPCAFMILPDSGLWHYYSRCVTSASTLALR